MWDKKALHDKCFKHEIEFAEDPDKRIIFLCPKMPDEKIKISLVEMLPQNVHYQFTVSPKLSTMEALKVLLMGIHFTGIMDAVSELLKIHTKAISIPDDSPFWTQIEEVLSRDTYFTGWDITIGSKTISYNREMADKILKNTKRDHGITPDEIGNLHISLGQKYDDANDLIKELFPDETD